MARWEVWRTINGRDFKYIDADDEKHAKKLAAYHTKMSTIYSYFAKEITDAESVPATARSVSESETRTDTTAAQSSGSRGHLEDTLPRRGRVGSDAMGEQGAESVGSEGALPAVEDADNVPLRMREWCCGLEPSGSCIDCPYRTRPTSPVDVAHHVDTSLSHIYGNASPAGADAASLPYTAGSQTSKDAAGNAAKSASNQRMKIWAFLSAYGPAMFEEIADGLDMYNNSVSTRLTQMRDAGMIDFVEIETTEPNGGSPPDIETRTTRQGSQAAIFRALPEPWYPRPRETRGRAARYQRALEQIESVIGSASDEERLDEIANIVWKALGERT